MMCVFGRLMSQLPDVNTESTVGMCHFYHVLHCSFLHNLFQVINALSSYVVLAGATKLVTDTLQHDINAAARVVNDTRKWPEWPESYTMIYTGALWQIESPINLVSSCTEVSMARLCGTLLTVANWSLTSSISGVSGQPHSNWWWCHDTVSPLLAAEHSLCTARWCGTHCPTISMFKQGWKIGYSLCISVLSILESFARIRSCIYTSRYENHPNFWRVEDSPDIQRGSPPVKALKWSVPTSKATKNRNNFPWVSPNMWWDPSDLWPRSPNLGLFMVP